MINSYKAVKVLTSRFSQQERGLPEDFLTGNNDIEN